MFAKPQIIWCMHCGSEGEGGGVALATHDGGGGGGGAKNYKF